MTETKKVVKRFNEHAYNVRLDEIKKVAIPSLIKKRHLLTKLEKGSLQEFEQNLLDLTGFKSVEMAVKAYEFEKEWMWLRKYTADVSKFNLTEADVTKDGKLTKSYLKALREEYTTYYSKEELEVKDLLEKACKSYNEIPIQFRKKILIDRSQTMIMNPFDRY